MSHHDPAVQDKSNRLLFNRQKQLLNVQSANVAPSPAQIANITQAHKLPVDIAELFADVSFPEFVAIALTRLWLDIYNSQDGAGLFQGMSRYEMLEPRLRQAAVPAGTLRNWWDRLCNSMQVPIHGGDYDLSLLDLLTIPLAAQQLVLRSIIDDYRSIIALARLWHSTNKLMDANYAAKVGKEVMGEPTHTMIFPELTIDTQTVRIAEVPAVTANTIRHECVRAPSWLHLCQMLGIEKSWPGSGQIPEGAEAIFVNGGNIEAGAKQPSNPFALAWRIRETWPSLDLLGGVADSFDLGESRLQVFAHLVCRENYASLGVASDLASARVSVFDMLDDVTETRQATDAGLGQMIFSFETLAKGVQILARFVLAPFTPDLTRGALLAALETYIGNAPTIAGQAARGFGEMCGEWLEEPVDYASHLAYNEYLNANRETLLTELVSGRMGTGSQIFKSAAGKLI